MAIVPSEQISQGWYVEKEGGGAVTTILSYFVSYARRFDLLNEHPRFGIGVGIIT